jgi:hypothetical protein
VTLEKTREKINDTCQAAILRAYIEQVAQRTTYTATTIPVTNGTLFVMMSTPWLVLCAS